MKKTLMVLFISVVMVTALFAYEGSTSASFAYSYREGNYLGISSDNTGYFGSSTVGYYAGVDATFNVKDITSWKIGLIAGPSFRYSFNEARVNVNASVGISAEGTEEHFAFGIGSYLCAEWKATDHFGLGVGVKLGNNFVSVPFNDLSITTNSRFFVTPTVGVEFYY